MCHTKKLTKLQKEVMTKFYSVGATKVIFNKKERAALWNKAKSRSDFDDMQELKNKCPALAHQIKRSYESGKNIQSAVFSECVYAQTFAQMLNLDVFVNCYENENYISAPIKALLNERSLPPRYLYTDAAQSRMLIQAGGCNGTDCALIIPADMKIYMIEFKEPGAKISEPDLPKYNEDGKLLVTEQFLKDYPQFRKMLNEQKDLNFFTVMGSNVKSFSTESIKIAVSENYTKKHADFICTEDRNGYLVLMPADQAPLWAKIEGEIRPAGRNHYCVWTPNALKKFLAEKGATFCGDVVSVDKSKLGQRKERGGNNTLSGYKINNLFFVYACDCTVTGSTVSFNINKVRQLNPTIAGKMFFKNLKYAEVKSYYGF